MMQLELGDPVLLINPAIGTGLKHYLSIGSDFGSAKLRVVAWTSDSSGWMAISNGGDGLVTVNSGDGEFSQLMGIDIRKISIRVESKDPEACVGVDLIATPVRA
jgi:hypothetical protein